MPYCTADDIRKQMPEEDIVQLSDDAGSGVADVGVVSDAISGADALIDAHLRPNYTTPLAAPVPTLILNISVDLAIFNLYSRRFRGNTEGVPRAVVLAADNARADLLKIQRGVMTLDVPAQPKAGGAQFLTNCVAADRVFDRDTLSRF